MADYMDWFNPGYRWDGAKWVFVGRVPAGTLLGYVNNAPVYMPVDYDPSADNARWGINGTQEGAMRRALRWASDMLNNGIETDFQSAFNFALAQLSSDIQRDPTMGGLGTSLGWNPKEFRYNDFGEKYNSAIAYDVPTKKMGANGVGVVDPGMVAAQKSGAAKRGWERPAGSIFVYSTVADYTGSPPGNPGDPGGVRLPGNPGGTGDGNGPPAPTPKTPPVTTTPGTTPTPPAPVPTAPGELPWYFQPGAGQTIGDESGIMKVPLSSDQTAQRSYVMNELGINPEKQGAYTDSIVAAVDRLLNPFREQSLAGTPDTSFGSDHPQYVLDQFVNLLKGGTTNRNLSQVGRSVSQSPTWQTDLATLGTDDQISALQQNLGLRLGGAGDFWSSVWRQRWQNAFGKGGRFYTDALQNPNLTPMDWLKNNPEYRGLLSF